MPFPDGPYSNNQIHNENGISYRFDSSKNAWLRPTPITGPSSVTPMSFPYYDTDNGGVLSQSPLSFNPDLSLTLYGIQNEGRYTTFPASTNENIISFSSSYQRKTVQDTTTFTFSDITPGLISSTTVEINHVSGTINWPSNVKWSNNQPPVLITGNTHLFMFVSRGIGDSILGSYLANFPV